MSLLQLNTCNKPCNVLRHVKRFPRIPNLILPLLITVMTSSYNTMYSTACLSTTGSIQMLLTFIRQNLRATITRICKTQLGCRTSNSQNKSAVLVVFSLVKVLFILLLFSATRRGFYPGAIARRDDKCNFSGASAHSCSLNN